MEIVNKYIDAAGKYRIVIKADNDISFPMKLQSVVSDDIVLTEAQRIYDIMVDDRVVNSWSTIEFNILENKELLKSVIIQIKNNPTLTLTQYNNYLNTLPWYDTVIIRYFIYSLALGIARHHGLILSNYTEAKILGKVRDWIVATPIRKIAKVVLNNVNEDL